MNESKNLVIYEDFGQNFTLNLEFSLPKDPVFATLFVFNYLFVKVVPCTEINTQQKNSILLGYLVPVPKGQKSI